MRLCHLSKLSDLSGMVHLFYRARGVLQMGYPVYCIVEIGNKTFNGEVVNAWQWSAEKVNVKLNDGREISIPMDAVKHIKSY